jgi:hypothetical protein
MLPAGKAFLMLVGLLFFYNFGKFDGYIVKTTSRRHQGTYN